jgi:hypothetical protein
LLKLIGNKRLSFSQTDREDNIFVCSTPKERKSLKYKIPLDENSNSYGLNNTVGTINITNNNYNTINITTPSSSSNISLRSSIRKGTTNHNNINNSGIQQKQCPKHNRPLEVICLDDKEKICANCALFGEHKTHNIINEEDFFKEISLKAEILIDLYELIDFNINTFDQANDTNCDERFDSLKQQTESFFADIYSRLKNKENEIIEELMNKKEEIKKIALKTVPQPLQQRADEWKNTVQNKLDRLNEITDNEKDDLFHLIDNNSVNQDLIIAAEGIVDEFSKAKSTHIETHINTINLSMDKNKVNEFLNSQYIRVVDENNIIDNLLLLNEDPPIDRFSIQFNTNTYSDKKKDCVIQMSPMEESPMTKASGGTGNGAANSSFLNLSQDSALNSK